MKTLKFTSFVILTLFTLFALESIVLMLATGTVFNSLSLPILNNLDFLILLIKNNFLSGLRELIAQPVLIIGKGATLPGEYLSALYYYPISSLLHILFASFIASLIFKKPQRLIKPLFIFSGIMFLTSINYIWLAGCCGAAPGWTFDTMLLNYVFTTNASTGLHMNLYEALYDWMTILQIIFMFVSVLLLWRVWQQKK